MTSRIKRSRDPAMEHRKPRLSIKGDDEAWMAPNGAFMFETPGLSEDLRLLRNVIKAQREGVELFPGQQTIAPLLTSLFDKPLQVLLVGEFKMTTAEPTPENELHKFELAKPAEGVAAAIAAIRALNRDF